MTEVNMETVTLKNGAEEVTVLVALTMKRLKELFVEHPMAFYQLTMKCRDNQHKIFGNAAEILKDYQLIEPNGSIHGSTRNIVLSAVEGDKMQEIYLRSPLKPQRPPEVAFYSGRQAKTP